MAGRAPILYENVNVQYSTLLISINVTTVIT